MATNEDYFMIKKSTLKNWTIVILGVLVLYLLFFNGGTTGNTIIKQGNNVVPTVSASGFSLSENDPVLGDENAPISVVEFSDFQCPFCARAAYGAVAELKTTSEFADGDINFIYKQFPLNSIHPQAQKAAEASLCAADQGAFWEYHDLLFANQGALAVNDLKGYAGQLGLNQATFDSCLDSGEKSKQVSEDTATATKAGGRGTPFFVIYNKETGKTATVSGAVPYSQIESAIASVE